MAAQKAGGGEAMAEFAQAHGEDMHLFTEEGVEDHLGGGLKVCKTMNNEQ